MDASAELFEPLSGRCSVYFACFWSHENLPDPATSFVNAIDARVRVRYDKGDAQGLCSPVLQFAVQYLHDNSGGPEVVPYHIGSSIAMQCLKRYEPTREWQLKLVHHEGMSLDLGIASASQSQQRCC